MKPIMLIGIALIAFGVIALTYHRITYTTREKVLQFGPFEATAKTENTIPLPPILGGFALAGGIVLIIIGVKKLIFVHSPIRIKREETHFYKD